MFTPSCVALRRFAPSAGPLINLTPTADGLYLQVVGELDIAAVPKLDGLVRALERAPRTVYVDLAAVRFADSTGLSPFFRSAERRLIDNLPPLTITSVSRAVWRVVRLLADDSDVRAFAVSART
jgi:anti-anti-sigma factor